MLFALRRLPGAARAVSRTQVLRTPAAQRRTLSLLASTTPRRPVLASSAALPSTTAQTTSLSAAPTLACGGAASTGLGAAMQVRGVKRNTYDPSHFVRKRRHGFLARQKSKKGVLMLKRRRAKGRTNLSHR